jgi:hypothetical protein
MPSAEGQGKAQRRWLRAWDAYASTTAGLAEPFAQRVALAVTEDMVGFWVLWQLYGGYEGLQEHFGMSRASVFRKVKRFRRLFGEHPDVFEFPGITIDLEAYLAGIGGKVPEQPDEI